SAHAVCSPAAHFCTSAASRPPTSAQPATRACFTETSTIPSLDTRRGPKFRQTARIEPTVKRSIAVLSLLALLGVGGASAYQAATRQRDYGILLARGDNALRDDQTFAAIEAYSGAIALHQDSMIAYLRRGQTYQRRGDRGDLERAASDFRMAS